MLRHSLLNEIPLLTEYSKRAFASDIDFGGEGGGPEGYDLIEWHRMQFEKRNLYSLVIHDAVEAEAVLEKKRGFPVHSTEFC